MTNNINWNNTIRQNDIYTAREEVTSTLSWRWKSAFIR